MSIEEETVELSLAYHGLREENQELKSLLQEYREIVQVVATEDATYYNGYFDKKCVFCDGEADWSSPDSGAFQHTPECPVIKARKLIEPAAGE